MKNLAVFVSGSGTNLENIASKIAEGKLKNCKIALVVCDNPEAYALKRAKRFDLETLVVKRTDYLSKADFEEVIIRALKEHSVDYIVLAGFMRILSPEFVEMFKWRIINIHPARPNQFPGAHGIEDFWKFRPALTSTAATVHFVDSGIDTGPIIDEEEVARELTIKSQEDKIHQAEYRIYPKVIQLLVDGKISVKDGKVVIARS